MLDIFDIYELLSKNAYWSPIHSVWSEKERLRIAKVVIVEKTRL